MTTNLVSTPKPVPCSTPIQAVPVPPESLPAGAQLTHPSFVAPELEHALSAAYAVVRHILDGTPHDATQFTDEMWNFVFGRGEMPVECAFPRELLIQMRKEYDTWYDVLVLLFDVLMH